MWGLSKEVEKGFEVSLDRTTNQRTAINGQL